MVAIAQTEQLSASRWAHYVPLALMLQLAIAYSITVEEKSIALPPMAPLTVNLLSLATPVVEQASAPAPVQEVAAKPKPPIVTKKPAERKIAKPKVKPKVEKPLLHKRKTLPKPVAEITPKQVSELPPKPVTQEAKQPPRPPAATVIQEGKARKQVPPIYPRRAQQLGQQGTVTLHARVDASGLPRELKMAQSSGHRLLDLAAMEAVKKWEFEPNTQHAFNQNYWVRVPVKFVIQ